MMKLGIGLSKWLRSLSPYVVHIIGKDNGFLCGRKYLFRDMWDNNKEPRPNNQPTCIKCIKISTVRVVKK